MDAACRRHTTRARDTRRSAAYERTAELMRLALDAEAGGRSATRWWGVCFLALCGAALSGAAVEAQPIAEVGLGEVVRLVVPVPGSGSDPIALHIEPAHGVTIHASHAHFDDPGEIVLIATVPSTTGPGW